MIRVLVTAAGGAPAANFVRSLRRAPEEFHLIGVDANKYTLQRAETDERVLVPPVSAPDYLAVLKDVIAETEPDFLHCQVSGEMLTISRLREALKVKTFLPTHEVIETCENKMASFLAWRHAGLKVPETMLLSSEEDLRQAFDSFGPKLWLREIRGSAGRGALPTDDFATAQRWIEFRQGWGKFTAAECLEEQSITWQSIWCRGELMAAQGRKRLYWEFGNRAPSGVTGITGTGVTVSEPELDMLAEKAIRAIDDQPHGIYGVDLTYDREGVPNPTEINIGRFFTTHYFFTAAGLNMPYLFTKLGLGQPVPLPEPRVNPLPAGLAWVRGMDREPVLTTLDEIEADARQLAIRRQRVGAVAR